MYTDPHNKFSRICFVNKVMDKAQLKDLIAWVFRNYGVARATNVADQLKNLGFHYATIAGISLSLEDLKVPPKKRNLLLETFLKVEDAEAKYYNGTITSVERFQKVIDTWNNASELLKQEVVQYFKQSDPLNSIYMMAFSGARGNISQVRQLVGMRGLMSDPQGQIIDLPIASNFREGLTVTEYFISSYGARKGLVDIALRTADSGYLTRRLVDVAQDVIIRDQDCGTHRGIMVHTSKLDISSLELLLTGRIVAETTYKYNTSNAIIHAKQDLHSELIETVSRYRIKKLLIRSPLTCESRTSVCQACYGWNLAHGKIVDLGEAVGIIAAQSIGEPGTQLTMRTFHTGGVFTGELADQIFAPFEGKILYPNHYKLKPIRTRHGENAFLTHKEFNLIVLGQDNIQKTFLFKEGTIIYPKNNTIVKEKELIAESPIKKYFSTEEAQRYLLSDIDGTTHFDDLTIEETNVNNSITRIVKQDGLIWVLSNQLYDISNSAEILVRENQTLSKGEIIAQDKNINHYKGTVRGNTSTQIHVNSVQIVASSVSFNNFTVHKIKSNLSNTVYKLQTSLNVTFRLNVLPYANLKNGDTIATLESEEYTTNTGGIIKYLDLPTISNGTGSHSEILGSGYILWIPEETHEINKDASLLLVKSHQTIAKGTELFKNIFAHNSGVVEIVKKGEIVNSIIIKPGELYKTDDFCKINNRSRGFLRPGEYLTEEITTNKLSYWEYTKHKKEEYILVRPVIVYSIPQDLIHLDNNVDNTSNQFAELVMSRKVLFKDGSKIKSVKSIKLIDTKIIVNIKNNDTCLTNRLEIHRNADNSSNIFSLTTIETVQIKQNTRHQNTPFKSDNRILVQHGQLIAANTVISNNIITCKSEGIVEKINKDSTKSRRIALITSDDTEWIELDTNARKKNFKVGQWIHSKKPIIKNIQSSNSGRIMSVNSKGILIRIARPYRVSNGTKLYVDNNDLIQCNEILASLVFQRAKTGDIVQGLPKIEEILEARKKTDTSFNPHHLLKLLFFKYLLGEHLCIYDATKTSLYDIQLLLVDEIQSVYQSQAVDINNKHIEVIVKQMTSKVKIVHGGCTGYLPGEIIELHKINNVNSIMSLMNKQYAVYEPVLLGITKASLNTDSFISAASFQETTKVLTEAALSSKLDWLRGLKENVIIGRLIPAGTGFNTQATKILPKKHLENYQSNSNFQTTLSEYDATKHNDDIILDDRSARNYSL